MLTMKNEVKIYFIIRITNNNQIIIAAAINIIILIEHVHFINSAELFE